MEESDLTGFKGKNLNERVSINRAAHNCLNSIKQLISTRKDIWAELYKLLEEHQYTHQMYNIMPQTRVKAVRMCVDYDINDVANYLEIPYGTLIKILTEAFAAIYIIIDEESIYPLRLLNKESLEELSKFQEAQKWKLEVKKILNDPSINQLVNSFHPLQILFKALIERGTILPLLSNINIYYPNIDIIDSSFYRFITAGDKKGGNLVLLRRVLYGTWLKERETFEDLSVQYALKQIGTWAFTTIPTRENELMRNIRNFFIYLFLKEFYEVIFREDFSKEDLKEKFPMNTETNRKTSSFRIKLPLKHLSGELVTKLKEIFRSNDSHIFIPLNWIRYFERISQETISPHLVNYIYEIVHVRDHDTIINEISSTLKMSKFPSEMIYKKSLAILDLILSSREVDLSLSKLPQSFNISLVEFIFYRYKLLIAKYLDKNLEQ